MRIAEAASKSGLGTDTIRYYEKCGLLPDIRRGADGHRRFSGENVEWLILLYWLRKTGMRLKTMRRFSVLYREGDSTISERKSILLAHSENLRERRADLDRCEQVLARKVSIYRELEGKGYEDHRRRRER